MKTLRLATIYVGFVLLSLGANTLKAQGVSGSNVQGTNTANVQGVGNSNAQTTGNAVLQRMAERFQLLDGLILNPNSSPADSQSDSSNSGANSTNSGANTPRQAYFSSPSAQVGGGTSLAEANGDGALVAEPLADVEAAMAEVSLAKIGEITSQTGLQLSGSAYYRFDENIGFDDDESTTAGYWGKAQVELSWDFLRSPLFNREGRIEEIVLQERISRQRYLGEDVLQFVAQQKELFRRQRDRDLAAVLTLHIGNLALLKDAQHYLLKTANISSDELMSILIEKAEAERQLATLLIDPNTAADNLAALSLDAPRVSLVRIDTTALYNKLRSSQYDLSMLALRIQLLEQQATNTNHLQELTLQPFVRLSHYFRTSTPNNSNLDAGITVRIPLANAAKHRRQTLRAEASLLAAEHDRLLARVMEEVRLVVSDIERMNRSLSGELQRLREQRQYLAMRIGAYNNSKGGYNHLARMKEYNKYLESAEKIVGYQYQFGCLVADLQAFLTDVSVLSFCQELQF